MARKNARSLWADKLRAGSEIIAGNGNSAGNSAAGNSAAGNSAAGTAADALLRPRKPYEGHVLGIDPSLRGTGLAVIAFEHGEPRLCVSRTLRLNAGKFTMFDCLGEIYKAVADYIEEWPVRHVALEQTIYVQNFQTAQILGAARGAAIAAASVLTRPVFEYPPLRVKQAVVGFGRASKNQVSGMTSRLLNLTENLPSDEADAAAVAIGHAFTWRDA